MTALRDLDVTGTTPYDRLVGSRCDRENIVRLPCGIRT